MNVFSKISFKLFHKKILIVDFDKENNCFYYSIVAVLGDNFELLLSDVAQIKNKLSFKQNLINLFFKVENINKFKVQGVYFIFRQNIKVCKFTYNDFAKNDLKDKDLYKFMLHSIPKNTMPIQSYHCFNYLNKNQQGFKDFSLDVDTIVKDKKSIMEIKKACKFCDIKLLGLMSDLFVVGSNNIKFKKKNQNFLVINISKNNVSYAVFNDKRIKGIIVQKELGYFKVIADIAKEFNLDKVLSEDIFAMVVKNSSRSKNSSSVLKIVDYLEERELKFNKIQQVLFNSFNTLSTKIVEFCSHNININSLEQVIYVVPEKYDLGYKDKFKQGFDLSVLNVKVSCKNSDGVLYSFNSALIASAIQYVILHKAQDVAMKEIRL